MASKNPILVLERSFYIGNYLSAILYGVELVMYFATLHFLFHAPSFRQSRRSSYKYIAYSTILLLLLTIDIACNAVFGQLVWIEHRDDLPGGAAQYLVENTSAWYNTFGTTSAVTLNFLGDGLLLHRCFIIWGSSYSIITFPTLLLLGALSMAILQVYEGAVPGAFLFAGRSIDYGVPYYSLTISFNFLVTSLIIYRLLRMYASVRRSLGKEHAATYTSVSAIMIESALPFTALGIAYIVPYARHSQTALLFAQLWGKFTCLSPQFIVLRVAMGKAWSKDDVSRFEPKSEIVIRKSEYDSTVDYGYGNESERSEVLSGGSQTMQGETLTSWRDVDPKRIRAA